VRDEGKSVLEVEVEGKGSGTGNREVEGARASTPHTHPDPFNEFVDIWPGNVQIKRAFALWPNAIKSAHGVQTILDAARAYADWVRRSGTEPRYVRSAVNWLRDEGWRDELKMPQAGRASPKSTTDQRVTDAFELAQQLRTEQDEPARKAIGQ
jgi:hypothetical protein